MDKQCLDVQQMQHLQELGLELKNDTLLSWIIDERGKDKPLLCISSEAVDYVDFCHYCIPAYTLQDVLDALPKEIEKDDKNYQLKIYRNPQRYFVSYYWLDNLLISLNSEFLIDAAYELLVWAIDNKFVETDKNE